MGFVSKVSAGDKKGKRRGAILLRDRSRFRQTIERNQILNVPRCLQCGKLTPLPIVCRCKSVAFCNEECERQCKDETRDGIPKLSMMLCNRFAATVATLPVLKKEGFSPGFSSQVGKSIDLLQIAEGYRTI